MRKFSLKDTKNDIIAAYEVLAADYKKLETQLKAKEQALQNATQNSGVPATVMVERSTPDMANIAGVIAALQSIQSGMSKAFNDNSSNQVVEAEQLEKVQKQIAEERTQIKALYDVELGDNTLTELIDKYLESKEAFEKAFEDKKKAAADELQDKRNAWKKERDEYGIRIRERDQEAVKSRKRERDEYTYTLQQERAAEDDKYAQKKKGLEDNSATIRQQKDEEWALREKGVAEREKQYKEYAEKFAGLDAQLKKETAKAESEAKAIVERDHKVKLKLVQSDNDSELKALDLQIQSLKEVIAKSESHLKQLGDQLEAANKQTQSIALKKLELQMTANRESYTKIHELAMEQAKNSSKGK